MCDDVNERRVPFHTLRQCVSERGFSACFPIQRRRHHHPQRQDATSTSNNGNILSTKSHRWDVHLQKNTQKCRDLLMCLRPPHPKLSQFISFPPTHCHRIEATRAGSIRWRRELDKKKFTSSILQPLSLRTRPRQKINGFSSAVATINEIDCSSKKRFHDTDGQGRRADARNSDKRWRCSAINNPSTCHCLR